MSEQTNAPIPVWFWVIAVVALLWNLMGCAIFSAELFAQEAFMEAMTEEQKEWVRTTPSWIYIVFAISVLTGLAGSVFLLMRKRISVPLFAFSLVAVVIQMGYTMLIAGGIEVMGPSGAVMPTLVTVLAIAWLMFGLFAKKKGWLVG